MGFQYSACNTRGYLPKMIANSIPTITLERGGETLHKRCLET
jgi:hypothetical protein